MPRKRMVKARVQKPLLKPAEKKALSERLRIYRGNAKFCESAAAKTADSGTRHNYLKLAQMHAAEAKRIQMLLKK